MEIKYDTPIEVTEEQYKFITREFSGVVAHRKEEGKFYIKVWVMKYASDIKQILEKE